VIALGWGSNALKQWFKYLKISATDISNFGVRHSRVETPFDAEPV